MEIRLTKEEIEVLLRCQRNTAGSTSIKATGILMLSKIFSSGEVLDSSGIEAFAVYDHCHFCQATLPDFWKSGNSGRWNMLY